jgi:hypothetical protein
MGIAKKDHGCVCEVCNGYESDRLGRLFEWVAAGRQGRAREIAFSRARPASATASRRLIDTSTHPTYLHLSIELRLTMLLPSTLYSVNLATLRITSIALVFLKMSENMVKDFADVPQKFVKEGTQVRRTSNGYDRRVQSGWTIRADPLHAQRST